MKGRALCEVFGVLQWEELKSRIGRKLITRINMYTTDGLG